VLRHGQLLPDYWTMDLLPLSVMKGVLVLEETQAAHLERREGYDGR